MPRPLEERHTEAIHKLRRQLFRKYTPSDFLMDPSTEKASRPLPGHHAGGEDHLGGLSWEINDKKHGKLALSVTHYSGRLFSIYLRCISTYQKHTIVSTIVGFDVVDEEVFDTIQKQCRGIWERNPLLAPSRGTKASPV